MSRLVKWACDPNGDNKVMECWVDLIGPGLGWAIYWLAHSKLGVKTWGLSEGSGYLSSRVEEIA
ncbi:unnamed protein product [Arabis nemorensis]|uniref:Uncharacterized protein n=1 Tax=Arabis nemorensis TaxID=586526 RepID=A0A565CPQ3_9BRAS|nr:unnamed protein product [Arabis nemorensis]